MIGDSKYVRAYDMYKVKNNWVIINTESSYQELTELNVYTWCHENVENSWTIINYNKFAFECGEDALLFKLKFTK
jgi:1,4-dihydroxy-2-naphthoyl-CoA synthase